MTNLARAQICLLKMRVLPHREGSQGRPVLCRVQCGTGLCREEKGDKLLLAGSEGLLDTLLLRWHWRSSQTSDLTKSIKSQRHLQSLMIVSRDKHPAELLGVCGEHGCASLTCSSVSQA